MKAWRLRDVNEQLENVDFVFGDEIVQSGDQLLLNVRLVLGFVVEIRSVDVVITDQR